MKFRDLTLCIAIFAALTSCGEQSTDESAGLGEDPGWVSGGGQMAGDRENPWFIQNTEVIRYCVIVDAANAGVTADLVKTKIKAAYDRWQEDVAPLNPSSELKLATQTLLEVDCADGADIQFQFGHLTGEQVTYLKDPQTFYGVAVRTSYDPVSLKGQGFIYIAPTQGTFAPKQIDPTAWEHNNGLALELVLTHEWGHVFGVPHDDAGIMDQSIPEVLGRYAKELPELTNPVLLLNILHVTAFENCDLGPESFDFWGLPAASNCVRLEVDSDGVANMPKMRLFASSDEGVTWQKVGEGSSFGISSSSRTAVSLYATKEQSVFTIEEGEDVYFASFSPDIQQIVTYTYAVAGGATKEVFLTATREGYVLSDKLGVTVGPNTLEFFFSL